jgi:dTDP-glucose 4,6-dehydratase
MPEDRILPAFIRRALAGEPLSLAGTGARGQDYVDVRDVAAAIEAALERRATGLLNIASGRCITNCELARRCVELLDSSSEVVFSGEPDSDDEVRWEVSIAAAAERLGYAPAISLDDSIATVAGR